MEFSLRWVKEVGSTNEVLLRADLEEYPFGSALLAERQSDGRGRHQRSWMSGVGGMYLSVLFRPNRIAGLSLAGAYAVTRLCREEFGLEAFIRWPNDVYVEKRKLAGILPQVKFSGSNLERAVLGIGLNVNQTTTSFPVELQAKATTLSALIGRQLDVRKVAQSLLVILSQELRPFVSGVSDGVMEKCLPYLEGLDPQAVAWAEAEDGTRRELGLIRGLGPAGELRVGDGGLLMNLGSQERLVLHLAPPEELSPTSPHS